MKTRTPRSPLFASLAAIAPAIAFSTSYTRDDSFRWDGDGPDPRLEGFDPYDVDVCAAAIIGGEVKEGHDYMGGHYDKPDEHDEDIGGYLPQMLEEAAEDLSETLGASCPPDVAAQIDAARAFLTDEMRRSYAEQMAGRKE